MTPAGGRALAIGLAALAGYVDALGFLSLGGFYVAFMSGNSTLLSVGMATGAETRIGLAGGLVAAFLAGVVIGMLLGRVVRRRAVGVLLAVAGLLAGAWVLHRAGGEAEAGFVLALAMGAENTVFSKEGQSGIGLTYMTGTLVRLGQRVAEALTGGPWGAVVPDALLWTGMLAGALGGALVFGRVGLDGVLGAVVVSLVMAVVAWWDMTRVGRQV